MNLKFLGKMLIEDVVLIVSFVKSGFTKKACLMLFERNELHINTSLSAGTRRDRGRGSTSWQEEHRDSKSCKSPFSSVPIVSVKPNSDISCWGFFVLRTRR